MGNIQKEYKLVWKVKQNSARKGHKREEYKVEIKYGKKRENNKNIILHKTKENSSMDDYIYLEITKTAK